MTPAPPRCGSDLKVRMRGKDKQQLVLRVSERRDPSESESLASSDIFMFDNDENFYIFIFCSGAGVPCYAWSARDDVHPLSCAIALSAVCLRDLAPDLVFPAPEADIAIEAELGDRVTLRRRKEAGRGWVAAYSLQAWPRDNNSRR